MHMLCWEFLMLLFYLWIAFYMIIVAFKMAIYVSWFYFLQFYFWGDSFMHMLCREFLMLLFYLLIAFYVFIVAFMMAIYVYSVYSSFCCLEPVYEVWVVLASVFFSKLPQNKPDSSQIYWDSPLWVWEI